VAVIRRIVHNLVGIQRTRLAEEVNRSNKPSYKSVRFRSLLSEKFLELVTIENTMK